MIRTILMVATLMFVSCCANAGTIKLDAKTTVRLQGVIGSQVLLKGREMLDMAANADEVTLLINSPGGSVLPGLQFMDMMDIVKSRGTKIRCVVPNLAASMAFHILSRCDSRYVLPSAILLFHPAKVGCFICALSASELLYNGNRLAALEEPINQQLRASMNVTQEFFDYHYRNETAWLSYVFVKEIPGFVEIVTDIQGIGDFYTMDEATQDFYNSLVDRAGKDF